MQTGIDVSSNNGHVDWASVARAGFHLRVRARHARDGSRTTRRSRRTGPGAGLTACASARYHLPYPGNSSAEQQADHFLSVANPQPGELLPAIDVENKTPADTGRRRGSRRTELVAWLRVVARQRSRSTSAPKPLHLHEPEAGGAHASSTPT